MPELLTFPERMLDSNPFSRFYCGCEVDFNKRPNDPGYKKVCEAHDDSKPWATILNQSSHWDGGHTSIIDENNKPIYAISRRYIGGCLEHSLHNLFWLMGGPKHGN